ncbi:DUF72 domain-containing protein [Pseudobacteriovorax antillogorgiicola]|uniref:Uncharacterized conserved protein YecE, DUF72 family n=1 Tax=Pseudobacteriovorax antillogorgiicola TaxID=1513793 RepID=A0A1Y6CIT5_9BACT|nr:DUF72 domain-containing protein [Pseudobacteriovorax antillogorgiicola]TCS46391.1 uncharacterized protein YecE (DUF72 family) [Pseudobacteriovorax antillogorgiicola]SMF68709.1 Uncharacterized conserved protein YecE, DUF72 family [Pseudobacteriovorax antillogorgiicola]
MIKSLKVGVSGWTYDGWKGSFYPQSLKPKDQLSWASRKVKTIEINGTFYRLQKPSDYENWYDDTPDGFIFAIKAPRYITHVCGLKDCKTPVANFLANGLFCLEDKLGPILWQLPPQGHFGPHVLEFMKHLPQDAEQALALARKHDDKVADRNYLTISNKVTIRHAIEIRNPSFMKDSLLECAVANNIAIVYTESAERWPNPAISTADFVYARFHAPESLYPEGYEPDDLLALKKELTSLAETRKASEAFVFFDNGFKDSAPRDAQSFARLWHDENRQVV